MEGEESEEGVNSDIQVWQNLLLYLIVYYILSLTYRLALNENGRVCWKNEILEFYVRIEIQ